jgi:hypothetical protein
MALPDPFAFARAEQATFNAGTGQQCCVLPGEFCPRAERGAGRRRHVIGGGG